MPTLRERTQNRLSALKTERSHYIDEWRDMADFVFGSRPRWLIGQGEKRSSRRNERLYNEHATFACNTLASGMMAGITSPARPWLKLVTPDPDMMKYDPVKEWLAAVERVIFMIFARSNFYTSMHGLYKTIAGYGTPAMGVYESFDDVLRCELYPIGSYCLAANEELINDTFYREYKCTIKQLVDRFGGNVSNAVKNLYDKGNYDAPVEVMHAIEPNNGRQFGGKLSQDMPFRSVHFECGQNNDQPLLLSGFRVNPIMSPRWEVEGDDVYACSYPGLNSIGTNKALQIEELDKAIAIEKMHNPPLVGDAAVRDSLDLVAGGVSFAPNMAATGKPGLHSVYDVNLRIDHLEADIRTKETRIDRAFYADLFLMISQMDRSQVTAFEIAKRQEEKMLMLGPVLERLNNELLDPVIGRAFDIAERAGILPERPQELIEQKPSVEYISVLAQAQKAVSTSSMEATAAFVGQLAQLNPEAIDKIDMDQMIDEHGKAKGTPPKTIRSDEKVAEIREARAQQQRMQEMVVTADQAANTAKTLSDTSTEADSLLTQLTGMANA